MLKFRMKGCVLLLLFLFFLFNPGQAGAVVSPYDMPNNKFGIHVIDENDINDAAGLVNSSGGQWGYVTIVIREDDRNTLKWQKTFDRMRELKLIPLVRLATRPEGATWKKPSAEDAQSWTEFLSSLNWVVQNRYIILFNEPNHANEWEGTINPAEYASVAFSFRESLKAASEDFFILPAGFDAAAPNTRNTMEISQYILLMEKVRPGIFKIFDGWTSHSYPNPAFQGSPTDRGKATVNSWAWEISLLSGKYGVRSDIPVFITETGWVHNETSGKKVLGHSSEAVGEFFKSAFEGAWNKKQVVAVTPFVLSYQGAPFQDFSWKRLGRADYYPHFETVQNILKTKGEPKQMSLSKYVSSNIPEKLIGNSKHTLSVEFENNGQSIWNAEDGYGLTILNNPEGVKIADAGFPEIKPGNSGKINFDLYIDGSENRIVELQLALAHKGRHFGDIYEQKIAIVPPPTLAVSTNFLFNSKKAPGFELHFYKDSQLVHTISVNNQEPQYLTTNLNDLLFGQMYYLEIKKEGYLSKTSNIVLSEEENSVDFGLILPDLGYHVGLFWGKLNIFNNSEEQVAKKE